MRSRIAGLAAFGCWAIIFAGAPAGAQDSQKETVHFTNDTDITVYTLAPGAASNGQEVDVNGGEQDVTWTVPRCPTNDTDILRLMTDELGKSDSQYIAEAYYDYDGGSCNLKYKSNRSKVLAPFAQQYEIVDSSDSSHSRKLKLKPLE
jgi:hypothetical protein